MVATMVIGVDVGGSKIAAGLVGAAGQVHRRMSLPTPNRHGPVAIIGLIADMCRDLSDGVADPQLSVGVGSPGVVDSRRGIVTAATGTLPGWQGIDLAGHLAKATGMRVVVGNDANAFALGEHLHGAGRGTSDAMYVTVGTSVGGALVLQDRLLTGVHRRAGELGHFPIFEADHGVCSCGRRGHLESSASGPAIAAAYARLAGDDTPRDLREVAERARRGDAAAVTALTKGAEVLGRTLAGLAGVFDPRRVVVGGGVTQIGARYWAPLRDAFHNGGLAVPPTVDILPAALGDDAGIVGAAALTVHSLASTHHARGITPSR
ncbi:ROK family protein [Nonomuraea sp. NPDC026600]|uniref:ROK family protein n=1 Tax=Nonomuraea sp. NPDC026600 TaxID=3155363 RepID=UPI0033DEA45A